MMNWLMLRYFMKCLTSQPTVRACEPSVMKVHCGNVSCQPVGQVRLHSTELSPFNTDKTRQMEVMKGDEMRLFLVDTPALVHVL